MSRVRVFVDFWNFQLGWNDATSKQEKCDWRALPLVLVNQTAEVFRSAGLIADLSLEQTIVHASVDPETERPLREWLTSFVDRLPSFDVKIRERRSRPKSIRCRSCGTTTSICPSCGHEYVGKPEKGVDAAIVTDLLSLAWQEAYDLALLVSSDADYIPAVEHVQEKGLKVVNASWKHRGHELQAACWASFHIDDLQEQLCR
ncbi:MAG: NYN domain-containing protein [Acidimicrobiales bacterium]